MEALTTLGESLASLLQLRAAPAEYLLPVGVQGAPSNLPTNTTSFFSTAAYPRAWYALAAAAALVSLALVASGGGGAVVGAGFGVGLAAAAALLLWARRCERDHAHGLHSNSWRYGVFVFPSGDVVVRLPGVLRDTDLTVEAVYVSRAEVAVAFAPSRCGLRRKFLMLHYLSLEGRPLLARVCETEMRDDVAHVADTINEAKLRAAHGGGAGGF